MSENEFSSALHAHETIQPGRPSVDEVRWRAGRRQRVRLAAAAASVALVLGLGTALVLGLRTPDHADVGYAVDPSRPVAVPAKALPTVPTSGAVADGPSYDCASGFSAAGLRHKGFALVGTVTSIALTRTSEQPTRVTLRVDEWLRGGPERSVQLQLQQPYAASGARTLGYRIGTRLLVAGDKHHRAHGCGFTRYWTASDAHRWRSILTA